MGLTIWIILDIVNFEESDIPEQRNMLITLESLAFLIASLFYFSSESRGVWEGMGWFIKKTWSMYERSSHLIRSAGLVISQI